MVKKPFKVKSSSSEHFERSYLETGMGNLRVIAGGELFVTPTLIKPFKMEEKNQKFFGKEVSSKKKKIITGIVLVIVFFWIIGSIGGSEPKPVPETPTVASSASSTPQKQLSKVEAQKELDELMDLFKKAELVKSYDFSEIADNLYKGEVYVDKNWYTQTVQFKKDTLAKISILRKAITGYSHFEMRDAYTNEKVAEVTSFSNSLEVYK